MRAILYSRAATYDQRHPGAAFERQERACEHLAREAGWSVIRRIREVGSGDTLARSGLAELRRLVRDGAAEVVVAEAPDRLARDARHLAILLAELERAGTRAAFVTGGSEGAALGRFIGAARREA